MGRYIDIYPYSSIRTNMSYYLIHNNKYSLPHRRYREAKKRLALIDKLSSC